MGQLCLPSLGENISQATVAHILIKAGDIIHKGQNIIELETEKAVLELPSPLEGTVSEILIKNGDVIKVGQPILTTKEGVGATEAPQGEAIGVAPDVKAIEGSSIPPPPYPSPQGGGNSSYQSPQNVAAAPSVRLLARELGIDIAQVPGSGPGGRISVSDVKAACKKLNLSRQDTTGPVTPTQAAVPLPDFNTWGKTRREPMNNVRKKTAEHLSMAARTIPSVTQFDKADITELEKLRRHIAGNKKISVTPFIIKVAAAALKKFPQFNASVDMAAQEIIYKDYTHIGVAVDTDRGLLVPVLKNVDTMSILQIAEELEAMAQHARLRKTTIEEMQGGCFTISNLGGIGGAFFTPIIYWPQVAILGVSRTVIEPVYTDGNFVPRSMLPLSLSYDHRLIDGSDGARFIRFVCEAIEQPFLMDLQK